MRQKSNKKFKIILISLGVAIFAIVAGFPLVSKAGIIDSALFVVMGWILALLLVFLQFLLYISGMILDLVLGNALKVQETEVVTYGWALARDVANMFFIIFLLVIAFATIFRIEAYQYKALLPKLILGILLVNFSRTIATIFIEFSNLLTAAFLNFEPGKVSSSVLLALMGVNDVFKVAEMHGIDPAWTPDFTMVFSLAGIVFIIGLLVAAIAGFAGMLVMRTIALLVLIVFSPLAFALGILPATKEVFDEWWKKFLQYILYAPLAAFALYLALKVGSAMNVKEPIGLDISNSPYSQETAQAAIQNIASFGFASSAQGFYGFSLVVGLLLFSIVTIRKIGGVLAGIMIGAAKGGMFFVGGGVARRVDRWMAKDKPGLTRKTLKGVGEALQKRGGTLATLGKGVSWFEEKGLGFLGSKTKYFSPTVIKKAWQERNEEADRRAYGESSGKVRTSMNRVLMDEDKTNYGKIAEMEEVDRRKKMYREANPGGEYPYYVSEWIRAAKDKRKEDFAALTELLEESNNGNEGIQRLIQMPDWKETASGFFSPDFLEKHKDVARGESITYNAETMRDMTKHILGDSMAKMIGGRLSAAGMETGNWAIWVGSTDVDLKTGELKWRDLATRDANGDIVKDDKYDKSQEAEAAGQLAKQGEGLNRAFRATHAELKYVKQADGTVKEECEAPSVTMQIYTRDYGAPQGLADRVGRSMGPLTQDAIAAVANRIRAHIGKGRAKANLLEELEQWLKNCEKGKKEKEK
jgi:hypothetical protein